MLRITLISAISILCAGSAYADCQQSTFKVVVPVPAGTLTDIGARTLFKRVGQMNGKTFVIENKPGAFGEIGVQTVINSADECILLYSPDGPIVATPSSYLVAGKSAPYDPSALRPIAAVGEDQFVLVVRKDLPVGSIKDLISYGKAHPNTLAFASANASGSLCIALLNRYGSDILEVKTKQPESQSHIELLAQTGQHGMCSTIYSAYSHIVAGTERTLGVQGPKRSSLFPEVPTLCEQGLSEFCSLRTWYGIFGPKNMSEDAVARLNLEIVAALADDNIRSTFAQNGVEVQPMTPSGFRSFVTEQFRIVSGFFREFGISFH